MSAADTFRELTHHTFATWPMPVDKITESGSSINGVSGAKAADAAPTSRVMLRIFHQWKPTRCLNWNT
ncbi:hypothetical protein VDGL01_02500 [Verticillium dahliae]